MILLRTWSGISEHFPDRWPEWVMGGGALGMAVVLTVQPHMFSLAPHYSTIGSWADEHAWALLVLWAGAFRVFALGVNGTFDAFRYSPHLRAAAAFVGLIFWALFTLGFIINFSTSGTSLGPLVPYGIASVVEAINVYRSSAEVGRWVQERR